MEKMLIEFSKYQRLGVYVINMSKFSQVKEAMVTLMEKVLKTNIFSTPNHRSKKKKKKLNSKSKVTVEI